MANPKWGIKRICLCCGKRFYDMQRNPIVCPSCDALFEISPPARTRRQRAAPEPEPAVAAVAAVAAEAPIGDNVAAPGEDTEKIASETDGTEDIAEAEENDAETIEDPPELGGDEDDVAEVLDGMEEKGKTDI